MIHFDYYEMGTCVTLFIEIIVAVIFSYDFDIVILTTFFKFLRFSFFFSQLKGPAVIKWQLLPVELQHTPNRTALILDW